MAPVKAIARSLGNIVGTWYEHARIDFLFETKNAKNARATYSLGSNGVLNILNESSEGSARAVARYSKLSQVDPITQLRTLDLVVTFEEFPLFKSSFVVMDASDNYLIVGTQARSLLWLLRRSSAKESDDDRLIMRAKQVALLNGYSSDVVAKFHAAL